MVIHSANLSGGVIFATVSLLIFRSGLRRLITSSTEGGRTNVAGKVLLIVCDSVRAGSSNRLQ